MAEAYWASAACAGAGIASSVCLSASQTGANNQPTAIRCCGATHATCHTSVCPSNRWVGSRPTQSVPLLDLSHDGRAVSITQAIDECAAQGGRLCELAETQLSACCGSGCIGWDEHLMWTSTPCDPSTADASTLSMSTGRRTEERPRPGTHQHRRLGRAVDPIMGNHLNTEGANSTCRADLLNFKTQWYPPEIRTWYEMFETADDVALPRVAAALSSLYEDNPAFVAENCIDSDTSFTSLCVTKNLPNSWIRVDMGARHYLSRAEILTAGGSNRLDVHTVIVGDVPDEPLNAAHTQCAFQAPHDVGPHSEPCSGYGRYVWVYQDNVETLGAEGNSLNLREVYLYGSTGVPTSAVPNVAARGTPLSTLFADNACSTTGGAQCTQQYCRELCDARPLVCGAVIHHEAGDYSTCEFFKDDYDFGRNNGQKDRSEPTTCTIVEASGRATKASNHWQISLACYDNAGSPASAVSQGVGYLDAVAPGRFGSSDANFAGGGTGYPFFEINKCFDDDDFGTGCLIDQNPATGVHYWTNPFLSLDLGVSKAIGGLEIVDLSYGQSNFLLGPAEGFEIRISNNGPLEPSTSTLATCTFTGATLTAGVHLRASCPGTGRYVYIVLPSAGSLDRIISGIAEVRVLAPLALQHVPMAYTSPAGVTSGIVQMQLWQSDTASGAFAVALPTGTFQNAPVPYTIASATFKRERVDHPRFQLHLGRRRVYVHVGRLRCE